MEQGVRAEVTVTDPGGCPLARLPVSRGAALTEIARCDCREEAVLEFTAPATAVDADDRDDVTVVYERDGRGRYRVTTPTRSTVGGAGDGETAMSDGGATCPCEVLETCAHPVADHRVEADDVSLTFYSPDVEAVRRVVGLLRARFDGVSLRSLSRGGDDAVADPVVVDRARLTDRQREALATAHEMGYFGRRRRATGEEVAEALEVSLSTFREHVGAGLEKVLSQLFDRHET